MQKSGLLIISLLWVLCASARDHVKILLIPLDDRPPCLQFTERLGDIAGVTIVTPPHDLLGRFTEPGQCEKIIEWLRAQDMSSFKAAIVSLDMIAYGGLVASRVYETTEAAAMKRVRFLYDLKKMVPGMPVYGQSVIMRLAPTSDGKNEQYRSQLARWADISPYPEHDAERVRLEQEIPAAALKNYVDARKRNLAVNMQAIKLAREGILDFLILSQDDAKPRGIHVADRESLVRVIAEQTIADRIIVQPGTDEVSMLLLSRALIRIEGAYPQVAAIYSSEDDADKEMPFEDRPLRKTVSYDIAAAGGIETTSVKGADLLFYVFTSRFQPGRAETFAEEIETALKSGKKVMVADVDPKGNTQGSDPVITKILLKKNLFGRLYSYASWNTAGNTIGTSLPQGLIANLTSPENGRAVTARNWFTLHRLTDDYGFHTLVRPKANEYFKQNNRSGFASPADIAKQVEKFSYDLLIPVFNELKHAFTTNGCEASDLTLRLPWNRTFEAEIGFEVKCEK